MKLLVDEIPNTCRECIFSSHQKWRKDYMFSGKYKCRLVGSEIVEELGNKQRMSMCPLGELK